MVNHSLHNSQKSESGSIETSDLSRAARALPHFIPEWKYSWVNSVEQLKTLADILSNVKVFSIDTETGGRAQYGETLSTHLSLIQIGFIDKNGQGQTYLVDVRQLERLLSTADDRASNPLLALKAVLENGNIKKVAHNKSFEIEQLAKYGIKLTNTDDTMDMARRARPDLASVTLGACVTEVLGFYLPKEEQTTDWLERPLTKEQIDYARADAEITLILYSRLKELLQEQRPPETDRPEKLLASIRDDYIQSRRLLRESGITVQYALQSAKIRAIENKIRELLEHEFDLTGCDPLKIKTSLGKVLLATRAVTALDVEKLKRQHPEAAEQLLRYEVKRSELRRELRARVYHDPSYTEGQMFAELEQILPVVGRSSMHIKELTLDLDEYYGTEHDRMGTVLSQIDNEFLQRQEITPAALSVLAAHARKYIPELPRNSLPAAALEILDKSFDYISTGMSDEQKNSIRKHNAAIIIELKQTLDNMDKEVDAAIPAEATAAFVKLNDIAGPLFQQPIDLEKPVTELLKALIKERGKQLALLREAGIANSFTVCCVRAANTRGKLEEVIDQRVSKRRVAPLHLKTEAGNVTLSVSRIRTLKYEKLKELYPELAEKLAYQTTTQQELIEFWTKKGISRTAQEKLLKTLWTEQGRSHPSVSIYPRYKLLYTD